MVSARRPTAEGTDALKVADWYINVSRDDAHWMLPPRDSTDSSIESAVRCFVD